MRNDRPGGGEKFGSHPTDCSCRLGLTDAKLRAKLADLGGTVLAGLPADFSKLIADETEKWARVVKFSGAKPN